MRFATSECLHFVWGYWTYLKFSQQSSTINCIPDQETVELFHATVVAIAWLIPIPNRWYWYTYNPFCVLSVDWSRRNTMFGRAVSIVFDLDLAVNPINVWSVTLMMSTHLILCVAIFYHISSVVDYIYIQGKNVLFRLLWYGNNIKIGANSGVLNRWFCQCDLYEKNKQSIV